MTAIRVGFGIQEITWGRSSEMQTKTRPNTRHKVLRNTFFRRRGEGVTDLRTYGPTDGPTDGRTDPLIEVLRST